MTTWSLIYEGFNPEDFFLGFFSDTGTVVNRPENHHGRYIGYLGNFSDGGHFIFHKQGRSFIVIFFNRLHKC
jgi:hypothetical protein